MCTPFNKLSPAELQRLAAQLVKQREERDKARRRRPSLQEATAQREQIAAVIEQIKMPALLLHRPFPAYRAPLCNSFLGGLPHLPDGVEWPTRSNGNPFHFLAQIDCTELPDIGGQLPTTGVLFFFAHIGGNMVWEGKGSTDDVRVIFSPQLGPEPRQPPPTIQPMEEAYRTIGRTFALPGEPLPCVYPKWPVIARKMETYDTGWVLRNNPAYVENLFKEINVSQAAEVFRVTGLPPSSHFWTFHSWEDNLPKFRGGTTTFPTVWRVVERICRAFIADFAQREERFRKQAEEEPPNGAGRNTYDVMVEAAGEARGWIARAEASDMNGAVDPEDQEVFRAWISRLIKQPFNVAARMHDAVRDGLMGAFQFSGDDLELANALRPYSWTAMSLAAPCVQQSYEEDATHFWSYFIGLHQMLGSPNLSQNRWSNLDEEVLLLNLATDLLLGFVFCDMGEVDFWIHKDDLQAGRFDKAWGETQGG